MENKENSTSTDVENVFSEYIPALLKCIVIIIIGYTSGRFKLFTQSDAKGMNKFVIYWILPSLLYLTLATSDLNAIQWTMIGTIMVTKFAIFIGVMFFCIIWNSSRNLLNAGIYAMLCAVSNDAALGNVIVKALYTKLNPGLPVHLFLIQPISILLFQPITLILAETSSVDSLSRKQFLQICLKSIWISSRNPLVMTMVLGLITSTWIPKPLPYYFIFVLNTIAMALPANVLFVLGMSMIGKFQLIGETKYHSTIISCYFLKMIATPIILRLITSNAFFLEDKDADFSFVYGVMAPYNGVLLFADKFGMCLNPIQIILMLSALSFFPFTYVTAVSTVNDLVNFQSRLNDAYFYYNIINLIFGFIVCIINFKRKNKPNRIFFWFIISQMVLSLGNVLITGQEFILPTVQKIISLLGQVMCNFWTANLAAELYLKVNKQRYFLLIGFGIPTSVAASILFYNIYKYPYKIPTDFMDNKMAVGAILVNIAFALLMITVFLTLYIRHKNTIREDIHENVSNIYTISVSEFSSTNDLHRSTKRICPEEDGEDLQDISQSDDQLFRFLIILCASMILRLFLHLFKIMDENKGGVFVIVKFLADFSSCGQALLAFIWFEFRIKSILTAFNWRRCYKIFSSRNNTSL